MELNEFKQVSNPFNIRISENINREKYPINTHFLNTRSGKRCLRIEFLREKGPDSFTSYTVSVKVKISIISWEDISPRLHTAYEMHHHRGYSCVCFISEHEIVCRADFPYPILRDMVNIILLGTVDVL